MFVLFWFGFYKILMITNNGLFQLLSVYVRIQLSLPMNLLLKQTNKLYLISQLITVVMTKAFQAFA